MYCKTVDECFQEINAYCTNEPSGYPFLVNTENFDDFHEILQRLEVDSTKQCLFVSDYTYKNGLPMIDDAISRILSRDTFVLIGISQAAMLRSEESLDEYIGEMLGLSISGHTVILLNHCKKLINKYLQRDPRYNRRVVLVEGRTSPLPQIVLTDDERICIGYEPFQGMKNLLRYMERTDDSKLEKHPVLTVLTEFDASLFRQSLYHISKSKGVHDIICHKYADLSFTKKEYGTAEQWDWLIKEMDGLNTFSEYVCSAFGSTSNLIDRLEFVMKCGDTNKTWLLWLAMHVFGVGTNKYASRIMAHSDSIDSFERSIYTELLRVEHDDPMFEVYYAERKHIIEKMPENLHCIDVYCDLIGKYGKHAIYYLTDNSERERYEFVKNASMYNYSKEEILEVLEKNFPEIYHYMQPFIFDASNTKLTETDKYLYSEFTDYFMQYKLQKLTNRIYDDFLVNVNDYSLSRPFMKLQPRSSIVAKIDKEKTGFFFFDALGVEFLAFIQNKCEKYGLVADISIGRCELPSITSVNKEFENTCPDVKKISDLDEIKHHSLIYDYSTCPYPIHLFNELDIIDNELKRIQTQLVNGNIEKAVILSDHGASRLAVIYGKESTSNIELSEKGIHSGRCCKISENPDLPQVSYEEGYAVLANYDRFKGSRAANLEVHGGATLEEVLVPVITLYRKPDDIVYCFVDPVIKYKIGQDAKITLFSNMPMKKPRIQVNGIMYEGVFINDNNHAEFIMPELKRTNSYEAYVYEDDVNVGVTLDFRIERATKQKKLF